MMDSVNFFCSYLINVQSFAPASDIFTEDCNVVLLSLATVFN
jgi:hypothetical protein